MKYVCSLRAASWNALAFLMLFSITTLAQDTPFTKVEKTPSFVLGAKFGYDFPLFKMPYQELTYKGNRYIGGHADYLFPSKIGIRLDYANTRTAPNIEIPNEVYFGTTPFSTVKESAIIKRHFVGIGPSYTFGNSRYSILLSPMGGYSWIRGGDAVVETTFPGDGPNLINTGFKDEAVSAKVDLDFTFSITRHLRVTLGFYYLRHFGVHFDNSLDLKGVGILPIAHGENIYDQSTNPYTATLQNPNVVQNNVEDPICKDLSSVGGVIGLSYRFGYSPKPPKEIVDECNTCKCPNDKHKVIVTVRDELSKQVIPETDVAIKNMAGEIIATGTTNSFGVVDFGEIPHNNYVIVGTVYGVDTRPNTIKDEEFLPNAIIQKELLYSDLRFILKGKTINKGTRNPEPNTIVSLKHFQSGAVKQDNSDGRGAFSFRLDPHSSYEVVGIKENRLSDIERVSTIGLTRSTTLFVDLELGMDDFDCGRGTQLDIKYDLDKWFLTPASKFELDRLIRYMNDHQVARVELSSHTDCRGRNSYNQNLSAKRAKSAVDYIVSKGISRNRIIAKGYGETRLLNHCSDGVQCSEAEHRINRRTEAVLLCN